jgi:hypothetical protein
MINISIPVKKHVKKYLIKKYGEVHKVTKKTFLGLLLLELINDKVEESDRQFVDCDKYLLTIPEFYFNKKGFSIDKNKARFLGTCLEKLFFEDFYSFVDLELAKGGTNAWKSVKLFLFIYNIDENEMRLESMYRNYQRFSKEKITEKKLHKIAIK